MKLFDCTGKVTMVTGGNGGIGLGFAMGCAKMGGDVAIWARNAEKNAAAKAELLAAGAGRVETYIVDVASEQAVIDGYAQLKADFGRLDCVFANSGRNARTSNFIDMDSAEWHDLLAVSQHGAFYTLREGARLMIERAEAGEPGGSLVFCGSLSMFQGVPGIYNYAASKGAMGAVIRGIACNAMSSACHWSIERSRCARASIRGSTASRAAASRCGRATPKTPTPAWSSSPSAWAAMPTPPAGSRRTSSSTKDGTRSARSTRSNVRAHSINSASQLSWYFLPSRQPSFSIRIWSCSSVEPGRITEAWSSSVATIRVCSRLGSFRGDHPS